MSDVGIKTKSVYLRIRKIYFDQIVAGTKKVELRRASKFWRKRLFSTKPDIAVFICGKKVHRRGIEKVEIVYWYEIPLILGRAISEQGQKDLNLNENNDAVYGIWLGDEIVK